VPLEAAFDAGRLTGDGGLLWVSKADRALGLCEALAACIPEWRQRVVRHSLATLVRQRVFQIACGYEDQDDADTLRTDPLLKLVCGRRPVSEADLASQPTFSRLENAVDRRACYQLAQTLMAIYLRERERDGVPTHIVLDLDGTDDPTHGDQEGTAYHGYFRQHMYHPLLVFDGGTDQLIAAMLRPDNAHGSQGVVAILKRLVAALCARWPQVRIELRADSGFAVSALYDYCKAECITACFADRLSCHRFWANQFRLLMHAAAYWLLDTLRRWLARLGVPCMQLDTLRLRLLKIGGRVRECLARVRLSLASSHPGEPLWRLLAAAHLSPGE
jgi:hypothetical protein